MNLEQFWQVIENTHKKKHIPRMQAKLLEICLSEMPPDDIVDCYNIFTQLDDHAELNSLATAAFIIGDGGLGNDGFWDFRGWLIAQGKDIYCSAIQNPEILVDYVSLEKREDTQYEAFIYAVSYAYENKTGQDLVYDILQNAKPRVQSAIDEISEYPRDTNDYYDEIDADVYPKLWAKFGW